MFSVLVLCSLRNDTQLVRMTIRCKFVDQLSAMEISLVLVQNVAEELVISFDFWGLYMFSYAFKSFNILMNVLTILLSSSWPYPCPGEQAVFWETPWRRRSQWAAAAKERETFWRLQVFLRIYNLWKFVSRRKDTCNHLIINMLCYLLSGAAICIVKYSNFGHCESTSVLCCLFLFFN